MAGAPVVLDGFFATFSDEPTKPVSLAAIKDEANANRQLIVHGQLVTFPAGGQPVLQPGVVQTPPITDWVIEYSANPSLWVCSQSKWFRLLRPANQYVPVHYEVQRKFDLSVRAMYILRQKQDVGLEKVHQLILNPIPGHYSGTGTYTVSDLQKEAGFVFGQLAVASKRLKLLSSLGMPVLMSGFAQLAPKEVVNEILLQLSDEMSKEGDDSESDEPGAKRQRLSHGGSRGWMDAKRLERERAADLARGAPPAACTDWRVEPHMVTDLLMIWDMCMSFCHLLQLPPITLPQFEAAIMPGPVPLRAVPHAPIPAAPGGRLDDDEDDDDAVGSLFPHHDFLGAGTSLFGPRPAPAPKPVDPDSVTYNLSTLLDADGASAGLILRDLHVALVKVIDGFSIKRLHDPPETSKLPADDNKTELWQEKTWQAVLDSKAPAELIQPGAREAAEMLKKGSEYYQLSSAQRLAVLRTLVDLALNSDVMRDYIEKKTEMAGAKPKGGFNILPPDMEDDRDAENMRSFTAPMLSVAELQDPMTWVRWLDGCRPTTGGGSQWTLPPYFAPRLSKARIGVRRPLGVDVRQRRYWAFGGRAGCWRIFVESVHGGGWGWYEGASLQALISWLRTGAVEREVPLLRALEAAPLPKKFNEDPLPPYPLILPAPPASGVTPSVLWTCEDLKVRRPDGYRLLPAPLLKGEYHQHVPAPGRVVQVQDRTYNCCEALLTEYIDFFSEPEVLSHMMAMLTQLQGNAAAQAKVVAQVEEQLFNAGYTTPAWNAQLRDVWVKSIAREGLNFKDVAMHLDALQYHIRTLDHRPTRLTFIRHMQSARCPLWTPQEGDLVVLMRTGCMVHLDKYAALAQYYNVDDITKAREMVQKLKPVEHFKVVAIGYRTYAATHKEGAVPMPKIEGQQQVKEEAKPDPLDPDVIAQGGPAAIQKLLAGIPGMPANAQIGAVVNVNGQQAVTVNGQLVGIAALIQLSKQVQQQQQAKAGPSTSQSGSGNGAEQAQGPLNKPGPATTVSPNRPGCMWMVLQHVQPDGTVAGGEGAQPQYAVVPLHIDTSLPDYLVRPDIYEQGMRKRWATGDRFRMYFGGKVGTKVGGMWYRGTVKAFVLSQGQPGEENYDPWESVIVQWDLDDGSSQTNVNPWEIEVDPEEAKRREEELRKAQHAAARAQRAEAKGRRSAEKLREILAQELGSEAEELESSSESESDITEDEDFDDDMPKRKYNRRKAPQRGGFNNANNRQQQQQQAQQQQLQAQVLATHQQHQQQQYALVQQLQRLQQVGQGNSAIAMQVMTALQNIQRAQQNLMMQHPAIFQQLAAQQQQRAGQPQGQQQQQQLQQQQMQQQQLQRQQQQGQGQQVHPHQQQIMQQAVARQGGQVMIAPGGQQQLLQQVQQQQQQQQPQQIMLQPGSQQAQLYQQQQAQLQYQRQQQGMQQQQQQLLAQQGMMQGQGQVQLTPQQVQMLRQQQQAQLQAQQQGQYQQYQ